MNDIWPVAGVRILCGAVVLRAATEADVVALAAVLPDDYELDPSVPAAPRPLHLLRTYWRDQTRWRQDSWTLHLVASYDGRPVGMQTMEGERFAEERTIDSSSWVAADDRGRGLGRAMRTAMLTLAFDGLGAHLAVTSAWSDNAASLRVSESIGYVFDRVERHPRGADEGELVHLHLDAAGWRAAPRPHANLVGVAAARPAFGA